MNRHRFTVNTSTAYTVEVVDYPALSGGQGRKKFFPVILALLLAVFFAMSSLMTTNQSAKAGVIDNAVRGVVCSNVYYNAEPKEPWGTPNTDDKLRNDDGTVKSGQSITAYEKYGSPGSNWTNWVGPDEQGELDKDGEFGGRKLVNMAGGPDSGIGDWGQGVEPSERDVFFNADQSCGDPLNMGWTTVGNMIMSVNEIIVYITGMVYQVGFETSENVIAKMDGTVESIVKTLSKSFYMEFFNIMVMMAALWMGYKGLVQKQSTQMAQGAMWMIGAAIVGMAMLANPLFIPKTVNSVVGTVSEAAVNTITAPGTAVMGDNDMCSVDEASSSASLDNPSTTATAARTNVRTFQCTIWNTFLYGPWQIGQFGHVSGDTSGNDTDYVAGGYGALDPSTPVLGDRDLPKNINFGSRQVGADWALLQFDSKVAYAGADKTTQGQDMLHVASSQTMRDDPNRTWAGQSSINRVSTAAVSFVAVLAMGAMVIILALELILLQLLLLLLTLMAPIFALAGVHPGFGRRVALMWLNTILELALRRIVLSILLGIMVLMFGAVMAATAKLDWIITMIMVIAVAIGGLNGRSKVLGMFSNTVNMGGAGSMGMANASMDKALAKTMNIAGDATHRAAAAGAAAATVLGAPVVGAGINTASGLAQKARNQEGGLSFGVGGAGARPGERRGSHAAKAQNTTAPDNQDGQGAVSKDLGDLRPAGGHQKNPDTEGLALDVQETAPMVVDPVMEDDAPRPAGLNDQADQHTAELPDLDGYTEDHRPVGFGAPATEDVVQEPVAGAGGRPAQGQSPSLNGAGFAAAGAAVAGAGSRAVSKSPMDKATQVPAKALAGPVKRLDGSRVRAGSVPATTVEAVRAKVRARQAAQGQSPKVETGTPVRVNPNVAVAVRAHRASQAPIIPVKGAQKAQNAAQGIPVASTVRKDTVASPGRQKGTQGGLPFVADDSAPVNAARPQTVPAARMNQPAPVEQQPTPAPAPKVQSVPAPKTSATPASQAPKSQGTAKAPVEAKPLDAQKGSKCDVCGQFLGSNHDCRGPKAPKPPKISELPKVERKALEKSVKGKPSVFKQAAVAGFKASKTKSVRTGVKQGKSYQDRAQRTYNAKLAQAAVEQAKANREPKKPDTPSAVEGGKRRS